MRQTFTLVITGDLSFGENYQAREEERGRKNVLKERGYLYTIEKLAPFLKQSDLVISNLETVLTERRESPHAARKSYVHWSDVRETPAQLLANNIAAVTLANNHSVDFGQAGLIETLQFLSQNGIAAFGAGRNLAEASRPFDHKATIGSDNSKLSHIRIRAFAAFAVDDKYRDVFRAYATPQQPGTNPLVLKELCDSISAAKAEDPRCFIIVLLHWRRDYMWRSNQQHDAASALLRAGADFVTGHGSHMMQELEKIDGRWVVHGLGNFLFNSPGRYAETKTPPYSFVARLIFSTELPSPRCLLYPLMTDNRLTGFQTRFVTRREFDDVLNIIRQRTNDPASFDREVAFARDDFGRHLEIPLGIDGHERRTRNKSTAGYAYGFSLRPVLPRSHARPRFSLDVTHTYVGASIHASKSAVRFAVNAENLDADVSLPAPVVQLLLDILPEIATSLSKVTDSPAADWLRQARLRQVAAMLVHAIMHKMKERISPVRIDETGGEKSFHIICEYDRSADNAKSAASLAVQLLEKLFSPAPDRKELQQLLDGVARRGRRRRRLAINGALIQWEAESRGIPVNRTASGPTKLGHGRFHKRFRQSFTSDTSYLAVRICQDKQLTSAVLAEAGLPVPKQALAKNVDDALAAAASIGYPIILKPLSGNQGRGVSGALYTPEAAAAAFAEAAQIDGYVIVEQFIPGTDFRLLIVDGNLVAACNRVPGHLIGNGQNSISELIETYNSDPRREDNWELNQITIDYNLRRTLADQQLTLASIPQDGRVVFLKSKIDATADAIGVTSLVHPDNRRMAIAAAQALNLNIAGIDFITPDISKSYKEVGGAICEVNSCPAIDIHMKPTSGPPVNVAAAILDSLFPLGSNGRIPIIAVADGPAASTIAEAAAQILRLLGFETGLATEHGVWIDGDRILRGDFANASGAQQVLWNSAVDAAVLRMSNHSILNEGLGFDCCDILLLSEFPQQQESLAALAVLIRSARSALIRSGVAVPQDLAFASRDMRQVAVSKPLVNIGELLIEISALPRGAPAQQQSFRIPAAHWLEPSSLAPAAAACLAIDIDSGRIREAISALSANAKDLLFSTVHLELGSVMLATPRSAKEVKALCSMARSWTSGEKPEAHIHMEYNADQDLRAAMLAETEIGFFAAPCCSRQQLEPRCCTALETFAARKRLILTDRPEWLRRKLLQDRLNATGREFVNHTLENVSDMRLKRLKC
jgi:D-alanine-D-alanine ligase-like ATP-grasp enzyme/poly-gamma-glutamate capsule biosynthesis protein CapA/YwtB (metallophosphatase superfamily)